MKKIKLKVGVAKLLTLRTPDLEVRGLSLAHHAVSLDKTLLHLVSLHPGV